MSLESWKQIFEIVGIFAVGVSVVSGALALVAGNRINKSEAAHTRKFEKDLTDTRVELGKQQTRAANAERDASDAKKAAGDADAKAEGFRLDIAKANERAAEAEARAAQANLELARLRTPRSLNSAQQKRVAEKIKSFSGVHFDTALFNDPEANALLLQIEDTLKTAGWTQINWDGGNIVYTRDSRPTVGLVSTPGVIIQMHTEHVSEFWPAAQALASSLNAEGIAARAEPGIGPKNDNPMAIHILIGKKPQ